MTNVEQRVDRVLEWVAYQTKRTPAQVSSMVEHDVPSKAGSKTKRTAILKRQALVDVVIEALYHFEADRAMLKQGKSEFHVSASTHACTRVPTDERPRRTYWPAHTTTNHH